MKKILTFILFALLILPLEGQIGRYPFYTSSGPRTYATVLNDGNTWGRFIATSEYITLDEADSVVTWANSLGDCSDLGVGTANTARKPTFVGDSITFNGVQNVMYSLAVAINQPVTIYIVLNQISWEDENRLFGGESAYVKEDYSTPDIRLYAGSSSSRMDDLAIGTRAIIRAVFDGANSSLQVNENTAWEGSGGTNNFDRFVIGNNVYNDYTNNSNISVFEIIIRLTADSAGDQQLIYDYLEATYL